MSNTPTVRLLSCTAYPLETLYIAAVSLDDPEVRFQKPEEIRMMLYTELSQHLKAEHKQFILDKMKELVNNVDDPLIDSIRFVFLLDNVSLFIYREIVSQHAETYCQGGNDYPVRIVWNVGLAEFVDTYKNGTIRLQQLATDACETILEIDPYLYQLITAK